MAIMQALDVHLITRVVRQLGLPPSSQAASAGASARSIWAATASSYAYGAECDEFTQPTGFCPHAALLFEAILEAALLVAGSAARLPRQSEAFKKIVVFASGGLLREPQISGLFSMLDERLQREGVQRRLDSIASAAERPEQAREVLRVASLFGVAEAAGELGTEKLDLLRALTKRLGLPAQDLQTSVAEAKNVLFR
ncbi:MAG TPA: hypothetical protein VFQ61_17545 [Polyangiaceae bacterium]|nr:hypothetical protein [Polyangiaceae bacterium]